MRNGGPEVTRADLRGEAADLDRAARAAAGQGFALRHYFLRSAETDAINQGRRQRSAKTIIDIHHGDAAGAAIEHAEERGDSAERCAIADAGRHGNDGLIDEPRHHRRQRTLHPGDDDQNARRAQFVAALRRRDEVPRRRRRRFVRRDSRRVPRISRPLPPLEYPTCPRVTTVTVPWPRGSGSCRQSRDRFARRRDSRAGSIYAGARAPCPRPGG